MKKLFLVMLSCAFLSMPAVAGNYDNTGVSINAEGEKYGLSIGTGATADFSDDAQVIEVHTNGNPINIGVAYIDDGTNTDWRYTAGADKDLATVGSFNVYGGGDIHYTTGDTLSKDEMRLSPFVGAETSMVTNLTPFVEVGYDWKSLEGDFTDFDRADSYASVGTSIALSETSSLKIAVNREMDKEWDATDTEASLGFTVKF